MRRVTLVLPVILVTAALIAEAPTQVARARVQERLTPGLQQAILSVYASAGSPVPLASETRSVEVDANGEVSIALGALAQMPAGSGERWLGVRIGNGSESTRIRLGGGHLPPAKIQVASAAAIWAPGFIESTVRGFRFPDGSVQTSAATIAYGEPVAVGTFSFQGVAATLARSDHVHSHGNLSGGTHHAPATAAAAGFMSGSDKARLDAAAVYVRTIVVSPTPGNALASGTALLDAVGAISGNSPSNPYLVRIEPGIYDLGTQQLVMKSYVDIEGSGQGVTFINATRGTSVASDSAAVVGAANTEIRHLTISNASSSALFAGGYVMLSDGDVRISDVTVNATGGTQSSQGVVMGGSGRKAMSRVTVGVTSTGGAATAYAVSAYGPSTTIADSTGTARGTAGGTGSNIAFYTSGDASVSTTIDSSSFTATGDGTKNVGIYVWGGVVQILNSTVEVATAPSRASLWTNDYTGSHIYVFHSRLLCGATSGASAVSATRGTASTLRIAASQLEGMTTGSPTCVNSYNTGFVALAGCPAP